MVAGLRALSRVVAAVKVRLAPRSLGRRIVASVALGLALVLLIFSVVALWTVREATDAAYEERVALAESLVWGVDEALSYSLATLEREAATLTIIPGQPIGDEEGRRLDELRAQVGSFSVVSVADAAGVTIWTKPSRPDIAVGQPLPHPGVQRALRTGEPQITQLESRDRDAPALACLSVPVRGPDGGITGVLMADLDPSDPALHLLPTRTVGDAMRVQLINVAGRVLTGSKRDGDEQAHLGLLADLVQRQVPGYVVHERPPDPGAADEMAQSGSHVVGYAPVSLLPSWGVLVEQPRDIALAAPRQLATRLGLAGLLTLLLAGAIAWLDVRRVVRPLQDLTGAAQRFAGGSLDEPIRLERGDELGVLAHAFETMRQRLRASLAEVAEWNRELELRIASRTAELERRNRELASLNAIAETVSGALNLGPMLDRTLDRVLEVTGADMGCFRLADEHSTQLSLAAERRLPQVLRDEQVCADDCLCGRAARGGGVLTGTVPFGRQGEACHAAGVQARVAVSLVAGQDVQGVLFLGSHQSGFFEGTNLTTLSAIGRQVGMALVNARLFENLQVRERERAELLQRVIVGQEEERRRLAHELHDQTSQALASLQLGLDRLAAGVDQPDQARAVAAQLRAIAGDTLGAVHRLAVELRPSVLDDVGLVAALQRYCREWGDHWGISMDFAAIGVDGLRLIPAAETAVYRIVQATLTNVAQHAQAQHVSVLLQQRGGQSVIVVEDDGRGFDLAAVRAARLERRLGLAGMEERASLIGATITIEATPESGTTVFLEVPVGANARREGSSAVATTIAG